MPKMTGGCKCGQVRYSANAEPAFTGVCHCTDCQKESGTAFNDDLDDAAKDALREMIVLIGDRLGLAADDAYMFASLAVDLRVTQLVDGNKGIHAILPKRYAPT